MISLNYELKSEDFLNLHLYYTSFSEDFIKQRLRTRYRTAALSAVVAIVMLIDSDTRWIGIFFAASAVVFYFVYPWWSRWFFRRMIKKQVDEKYKDRVPQNMNLVLRNDSIEVESSSGKQYYTMNDIEGIIETNDYFFIEVSDFLKVILPKQAISNIDEVKTIFEEYHKNYNLNFLSDLNWAWK